MTEIMLMRAPHGYLIPVDQPSLAVVNGWPVGQGIRATVRRARNIRFHRKLFSLLQVIAEYSDVYDNTDKALVAVKLASGHVDWMPDPVKGGLVPVPKTISFAGMDEDSFGIFYSRVIDGVLKHILPTMDKESLDRAVEMVLGFS